MVTGVVDVPPVSVTVYCKVWPSSTAVASLMATVSLVVSLMDSGSHASVWIDRDAGVVWRTQGYFYIFPAFDQTVSPGRHGNGGAGRTRREW